MSKHVAVLVFIMILTMSFTVLVKKSVYKANVGKSTAAWTAYKTGGQHNGVIGIKEGSLTIENDKIIEGNFIIDMNSIEVLDTKKKKLLNHLKSEDFFDVSKYPIATFKISKSVTEGDKMMLVGDLTIKGITQEIKFPISITEDKNGERFLESETFKVNRAKFNVTYKSKTFFNNLKDKFIYDEFDMKVKVVLVEKE